MSWQFINGRPVIGSRSGSSGPNGAPSNLVLTVVSTTSNKLDWTNGSDNEDQIVIFRSDDLNDYSPLYAVENGISTYTDITAVLGIIYYYKIAAIKNSIYSDFSNTVNNINGDITTGLVGQWLFNEASGATALDTGGANNGTIIGATRVVGKAGGALSFNGVAGNDSVRLGDILDSTFTGANKIFTISAWIKPAAALISNCILAKYATVGNQREFLLRLLTNSKLSLILYGQLDGATNYIGYLGSTQVIDTSKWYHIALTYDGTLARASRVKMYVDGVSETIILNYDVGAFSAIVDGTAPLTIGAATTVDGATSSLNWNGIIDSVNIFNRVLPYADILKLKYEGVGV